MRYEDGPSPNCESGHDLWPVSVAGTRIPSDEALGNTAPQRRTPVNSPAASTFTAPGTTAPQRRIAVGTAAAWGSTPAYAPDPAPASAYDPAPVDSASSAQRAASPVASVRRGASALRWIVRILCLGLVAFGALSVYYLTEQTPADTIALSSEAGSLAEYGAYLVQSGQVPSFEDNPVKWAAAHVLLLSVKFARHGLSVRQQAHVVEFALLGGVLALNVLAWMSGWAHRRSPRGRIRVWRTWLMYALSLAGCAAASFADQYHKLYVPGRHFEELDLFLDASGYIPAITCVFIAWSVGSAVYRLIFRK